jgi:hypothetical protein
MPPPDGDEPAHLVTGLQDLSLMNGGDIREDMQQGEDVTGPREFCICVRSTSHVRHGTPSALLRGRLRSRRLQGAACRRHHARTRLGIVMWMGQCSCHTVARQLTWRHSASKDCARLSCIV